jgi:hypothetical protein
MGGRSSGRREEDAKATKGELGADQLDAAHANCALMRDSPLLGFREVAGRLSLYWCRKGLCGDLFDLRRWSRDVALAI